MTEKLHKRIGAISNSHVGAEFETVAMKYFASLGLNLTKNFPLNLGLEENSPRKHRFDLGADFPEKLIIECKSHKWTSGGNVPSAKMSTWNEAMFYFSLAPNEYRKVFFALHNKRNGNGESLVYYYKRTYSHLIPQDVEFIEYDEFTKQIIITS